MMGQYSAGIGEGSRSESGVKEGGGVLQPHRTNLVDPKLDLFADLVLRT